MSYFRSSVTLLLITTLLFLNSCVDKKQSIISNQINRDNTAASQAYTRAKTLESKNQWKKADRAYLDLMDQYPFSKEASQAAFHRAQFFESQGDSLKAFDAYDLFIKRFPASSLYKEALQKQFSIAKAATDGSLTTKNMIGLSNRINRDKAATMLTTVRDNSPLSNTGAQAQLILAKMYHDNQQYQKAIDAYRYLSKTMPSSKEAPQALFLSGVALTELATLKGNNEGSLVPAQEAFEDFLLQYPNHYHRPEAQRMLANTKALKSQVSVDIADYYYKTKNFSAAKIYYRSIYKNNQDAKTKQYAKERLLSLGDKP